MSIKFRKFNSIEKTDKQDFIDSIYVDGFDKDEWVVTEKLHGSNLSLWYDHENDEIHVGKRSSFLKNEEDIEAFFRADIVRDKYGDAVRTLGQKLGRSVAVFGEMVGGRFDVEGYEPTAKPIQKGVSYTPHRDWFVFDIATLDVDGELEYIDWHTVMDHIRKLRYEDGFGVRTVPFLYSGNFDEAYNWCEEATKEDFETLVPSMLGFPSPEKNRAEGFVLKPNHERRFATGKRVILKLKHPNFKEKGEKKKKKERDGPKFSEKGQELFDTLCSYVTMNRLHNLISKEGEVDDKNFGKFIGMLNKDVLDDFMKDHGSELEQLDKDERKKVQKQVGAKSKELLINYRKGE